MPSHDPSQGKLRRHREREDEQEHSITPCMIDRGLSSPVSEYHFAGGMHAVDQA